MTEGDENFFVGLRLLFSLVLFFGVGYFLGACSERKNQTDPPSISVVRAPCQSCPPVEPGATPAAAPAPTVLLDCRPEFLRGANTYYRHGYRDSQRCSDVYGLTIPSTCMRDDLR